MWLISFLSVWIWAPFFHLYRAEDGWNATLPDVHFFRGCVVMGGLSAWDPNMEVTMFRHVSCSLWSGCMLHGYEWLVLRAQAHYVPVAHMK